MTEQQQAVEYLHETRTALDATVQELDAGGWAQRKDPESWCVAECVEHVAVTEQLILSALERLCSGAGNPERRGETLGRDVFLKKVVTDRGRLIPAPERLRPTGRWCSGAAALDAFHSVREQSIAFADSASVDLRSYFYQHLVLGEMDALQWLVFLGSHSARHTIQIQEILSR